jgi:hypothetical protein
LSQALAEKADAFGQDHAIDAVLHIGVVVTDMDLPEKILRHAWRLQQRLIERRILPAGLPRDCLLAQRISGGRCNASRTTP